MTYRSPMLLPPSTTLRLASASPRRRELLTAMGLPFSVSPCEVDESLPAGIHPAEAVLTLSERKAVAAAARYGDSEPILASDTLVELDGLPLGKPRDEEEALSILMHLSGKEHRVHTGVALLWRGRLLVERDTTRVQMRAFDREEGAAYVATGEPMDKAGAYGIQGKGGALVARIEGAFDTVVGLPTALVDRLLCRLLEEVP